MIPEVALLEIFDFYMDEKQIEAWHTLVHVCRKWREVVFGSPRRLDLRLYCKARTPTMETLDIWPPLPIVISVYNLQMWDVDNIVKALRHNDRVFQLDLFDTTSRQLEKVLGAMQQPFPELTCLQLMLKDETSPVIPASFLGGSVPLLQSLNLNGIPFPGLPNLLLSSTHLVDLHLEDIPHSGYISPEAMVTCLAVLTRLETLAIGFESPRSRPDQKNRRPPQVPLTCTVLPVLTCLWFRGVSEYLEDLVPRIRAPLLDDLAITFFNQLIFDTPQLTQFISRIPKFKVHNEADIEFSGTGVSVKLSKTLSRWLRLGISCGQSDWQLSSLAHFCSSSLPQALIPVECLYIFERASPRLHWQDDIESSQWLEFLHPFTSVKSLYISREIAPRIMPALKELVGERVTEVLPVLQALFLEETLSSEPVQEDIRRFVAARQLAGYSIDVSRWEREHSRLPRVPLNPYAIMR
jgi:hypothetical protein